MPRAKKNEVVDKTDDEKTLMEIENINPDKKKSKKIVIGNMKMHGSLAFNEDHFKNLTHLERSLNIRDANLKNIRRAVANYTKLDSKMKMQTLHRLQQQLQSKLPNTDILKKFKEL